MTVTQNLPDNSFVTLHSLSTSHLNSRHGFVTSYVPTTGRYHVILLTGQTVSLRPQNLTETDIPLPKFTHTPLLKMTHFIHNARTVFGEMEKMSVGVLVGVVVMFLGLWMLGVYSLMRALILGVTVSAMVMHVMPFVRNQGVVEGMNSAIVSLTLQLQTAFNSNFSMTLSNLQAKVLLGLNGIFVLYMLVPNGSIMPDYNPKSLFEVETEADKGKLAQVFKEGFDVALDKIREVGDFEHSIVYTHDLNPYYVHFSKPKEAVEGGTGNAEGFEGNRRNSVISGGIMEKVVNKVVPLAIASKLAFDLGGGRNWNFDTFKANFQQQPMWKKALVVFLFVKLFI